VVSTKGTPNQPRQNSTGNHQNSGFFWPMAAYDFNAIALLLWN